MSKKKPLVLTLDDFNLIQKAVIDLLQDEEVQELLKRLNMRHSIQAILRLIFLYAKLSNDNLRQQVKNYLKEIMKLNVNYYVNELTSSQKVRINQEKHMLSPEESFDEHILLE